MKLFGGGNRRKNTKYTDEIPQKTNVAPKPSGKKTKKKRTPKQKRTRITIIVSVLLLLLLACAAVFVIFVRPPSITKDPTINDPENGDAIDMDSLLNSGQRVDNIFTFVVCATDEDETRTDSIMVATMDVDKKSINIMNIPRDTMSNVRRSGAARKINAAYGTNKGIEQTKSEVEMLLGFKPDKFITVNFDGIAAIVDAIGGVDYEVPFRMQYDDPSQDLHIDLYEGMQHLNGKQTVEFLRWRHNNDYSAQYTNGDEGRVENQQKFLKKLAKDVFQLKNIMKIKSIANAMFENVQTDFTAGELLWMGMQALQIKNDNLQFFTLPGYGQMSTAGNDSTPYSFYFPYYDQTLELVNQYFNPYKDAISVLDMVSGPEGSGNHSSSNSTDNYIWGDSNEAPTNDKPDDSQSDNSSEQEQPPENTDNGSTSEGEQNSGGDTGENTEGTDSGDSIENDSSGEESSGGSDSESSSEQTDTGESSTEDSEF